MEDHVISPKTEVVAPVEQDLKLESEPMHIDAPTDASNHYVVGWKLAIIVAGVALACFLMLIDTMIISTVSKLYRHSTVHIDSVFFVCFCRPYRVLLMNSTLWWTLAGTPVLTSLEGRYYEFCYRYFFPPKKDTDTEVLVQHHSL